MNRPPPREAFTKKEWNLIQRLDTPAKVQHWLTLMPYNWEKQGGTMRSFREVVKRNEAHCLEAAVAAAVVLEQHGYPPLLFDIESIDLLDHVIFVFQEKGKWGSIAHSRDIGLPGRKGGCEATVKASPYYFGDGGKKPAKYSLRSRSFGSYFRRISLN